MKKSEKFIKTQEVLEELLKSGVINDPECIDDIIYHLEGSLTRLHYWKTELDEIYDQEYDCWSWICESITVLYAFDFKVDLACIDTSLSLDAQHVVYLLKLQYMYGLKRLTL